VLSALPFFKPTPEKLVRQLKDLPPAPKVLHRIQKLVRQEDCSLEMISELICLEPGLAGRVVHMSNSTKFGGASRVSDIMEAIQRVGMRGVQEIVTYALASQLVGQNLNAYNLDANSLWFRAIACGLAASSLAEKNGSDQTEAYTAGLLHGVGLLAFDRHVTQSKSNRRFPSKGYPLDFSEAEHEYLGFTHADTGAALLDLWGFSKPIINAVKFQMEPEKATEDRQLCMTLATARWARSLFCVPDEKIPELPNEAWMKEAGVQIDDFGKWLGSIRQGYNMAKLELRLG
jgi:HD-like signal output (HDOD) protein